MIETIVNVVGVLSNSDEIDDILNIIKVFLVEQRMKYLTYQMDAKVIVEKIDIKSVRKIDDSNNILRRFIPNLTVRGLN